MSIDRRLMLLGLIGASGAMASGCGGGGFMGEEVLDQNAVKALATLPSLDELRGKLIGLLQAPATKVAGVVQAPAAQLARVFSAYGAKEAA